MELFYSILLGEVALREQAGLSPGTSPSFSARLQPRGPQVLTQV